MNLFIHPQKLAEEKHPLTEMSFLIIKIAKMTELDAQHLSLSPSETYIFILMTYLQLTRHI